MSADDKKTAKKGGRPTYRIPESDGMWSETTWKASALLAAIGGALCIFGFLDDPERFGYSYLFGFMSVATLVFGGLFLCIAMHFTAGHWGITARRFAEIAGSAAPLLAVLFIPLAFGVFTDKFTMYDEWRDAAEHAHHGHGDHDEHHEGDEHEGHEGDEHEGHEGHEGHDEAEGDEHGSNDSWLFGSGVARAQDGRAHEPRTGGAGSHDESPRTSQEIAAHHHVLAAKVAYLSPTFWGGRAVFYLIVWILLGMFYWRNSLKMDVAKDDERIDLANKLKSRSALAAIMFGLTLTFAAFDWLMSLEPTWYSTIFGVVVFAGSACSILALCSIVGISLYQRGHVHEALNTEHFHDIGKLLFGFMCFWAYVSFSQWMLIWYAGIPEEAVWFHKRWDGGWVFWSLFVGFGHFVLPFYFLMSRVVKRNLPLMRLGALWLLVVHFADVYWFVLPQYGEFSLNHLDIGALLFCLGLFFTYFFLTLKKHPLIPIGDPRLSRTLAHHQSH